MARIFLSHSCKDNFEALAFKKWLISEEEWADDDVFLDLHNIDAGERWKNALSRANERCEAVVLLASPASLASPECRLEIRMAEDYGKEIIVGILHLLTVESEELAIYRERQIVDLSEEPREAPFTVEHEGVNKTITFNRSTLARIKARLDQLGISSTSFAWRPAALDIASPYPGLKSFECGEVALFFGRAGDIARGLSDIRKLRRSGAGQILVIQAASGAGKSSFLKAGLWPRLERDPDYMPIAILRPATGILYGETGIGRQMAAFFAAHRRTKTSAEIHQALKRPDTTPEAALIGLINEATEIGHAVKRLANPEAPPPTPILAVDQAEELFAADDIEESQHFLRLIAGLMTPERPKSGDVPQLIAPPLFIWTIRADGMDALLHTTGEAGLKSPALFALPPIPRDAYRQIIEDPLNVANQAGMRLSIDPLLVDALVRASDGADALPLLAFTLRQLLADNRAGAKALLTLQQFEAIGGMGGMLAKRLAAAQRESGSAPESLKRLFIPRLATWDPDANPPAAKRLVADEAELFAGNRTDLKPLAEALVSERLLTRSGDEAGASTLEVAHEALLRQPPLNDWLEENREFLTWREGIARARTAFEANKRSLLMGRELEIARGWLETRPGDDIPENDCAFIKESITADETRRAEEHEQERRLHEVTLKSLYRERLFSRIFTVSSIAVAIIMFGAGWLVYGQWQEMLEKESLRFSDIARQQIKDGDAVTGTLLALEVLSDRKSESLTQMLRPYVPEAQLVLNEAMQSGIWRDRVLARHTERIQSGAFSPDGTRIVTASWDKTARVWDAGTGESLVTYKGHTEQVHRAEFSPDGKRIVTASFDKTARVWDAATGATIAILKGHKDILRSAVFSPDGTRIVTASDDTTARVWDIVTETTIATLEGHKDILRSAVFSPDGARIVTASDDKDKITARVWDIATETTIATLEGHKQNVRSAVFSPDGARIVTASDDKTARVWDAVTGKTLNVLAGHKLDVLSAAFSPDGTRIVTASWDNTARVWDAATGAIIATLEGHVGMVRTAAFSPDGERVITASDDKTARVWDAAKGTLIITLRGHQGSVRIAAFSPTDETRIVSASDDKTARVWDESPGAIIAILAGHKDNLRSAAFSPEGKRIVTASSDNTARVWDAATGAVVAILEGHAGPVRSAAFSPDGTRIVTASSDRTARIWHAARTVLVRPADQVIGILKGHAGPVRSAAFSPDGKYIVTASNDKTARVWDAITDAIITTLTGHDDIVRNAAFSPDGKRIVTASKDETARVWDAATGAELFTLTGLRRDLEREMWTAAFSPDGTRIVTASWAKTARVWDAVAGAIVTTLEGHDDIVRSAAFSPDGKYIVTASDDGTARVWDAATGGTIAILKGHGNMLRSAVFSPDGAHIVTASYDKTARVWNAPPHIQTLIWRAKGRLSRCLTPDQRKWYKLAEDPPSWCRTLKKWPFEDPAKSWPKREPPLRDAYDALISQFETVRGAFKWASAKSP